MSRLVFLCTLCFTLQILGGLAQATPSCDEPEDPQIFPGSGLVSGGYPLGPANLGAGCPVHLLARTALAATELVLRDGAGDLPFTFTEEAKVVSTYPSGYDCDCNHTYTTATVFHYVLKLNAPPPHLAKVSLFKLAAGGQSEVKLAELTITKDTCDPNAGKEIKVLCSTCDRCLSDAMSPDTMHLDGGVSGDGAASGGDGGGGCSLAGSPRASSSPVWLLAVLGLVLARARRRDRAPSSVSPLGR